MSTETTEYSDEKFANLQERTQQTIQNIKDLQTREKTLYNELNARRDLMTEQQKETLLLQIQQNAQMRFNLYSTLQDIYASYATNTVASKNTLNYQKTALDIVEDELQRLKERYNALENKKVQKIRMTGINTYYSKKYAAQKNIMRYVAIMCVPIIILTILGNRGIIPGRLNIVIIGFILLIGIFKIGKLVIDLSNRDSMNFDEYNWTFNKPSSSSTTTTSDTSANDPWSSASLTCVGANCCNDGSTYDISLNKCVVSESCT